MPIVSRALTKVNPQADGTVRVVEELTTTAGDVRRRHYTAVSEAQAIIDMNARNEDAALKDVEEEAVYQHLKATGGTDGYTLVELTLLARDKRLLRRFIRSRMDDEAPCVMAAWVDGLTNTRIRNALGVNNARATEIKDRASNLLTVICPAFADDEAFRAGDEGSEV